MEAKQTLPLRLKNFFIGQSRSIHDKNIFHKLSLIAFFAWVGLGADALSSSSYGPEEAFLALGSHTFLGIFVALGSAFTISVISTSYSQIIELFPTGGGGYLVASKLLSPFLGMVSGCALIIDYILTITISIAAGAAAIFSFLPENLIPYSLLFAIFSVIMLTLLNLRGVKESIAILAPIFLTFIITHAFIILYALITHFSNFPQLVQSTTGDVRASYAELGLLGMFFLIMRAYSLGAGTFTGIEAVSNGLPILREPRVKTGKRTMRYMAISLSFMVVGLMVAYLFYDVMHVKGKTLNAVLFSSVTKSWGLWGYILLLITLISEAAILFVAAQAGFIDGPRVLANMALDRWLPSRFTTLSDRLVTQNGILIMGVSAAIMMLLTKGSVKFLVVLYSINVFITFILSEFGMVKYWWSSRYRVKEWKRKLSVNAISLVLDSFILITVVILKFYEGGWITLLITGALIALAIMIKSHYNRTTRLMYKFDHLIQKAELPGSDFIPKVAQSKFNQKDKTAVLLVRGFNGLGLHTLKSVVQIFGGVFKNFVFVEVGAVDAGNFRGIEQISQLKEKTKSEVNRYVSLMRRNGYNAESFSTIGIDVVDEVTKLVPRILERFPNSVFFGGQIVFPKESFMSRILHNYTVFAVQKRLYKQGSTVVLMPAQV